MKTYTPNYYKKFRCIAGECQHSCCIGWEIDIDEDTLEFYEAAEGKVGKRLRDTISYEGTPHFKLCEGNRCANLRADGLCSIICDFDEGALCDICADHPRFRNFYENFTEEGLGLCCEEAARIILNEEEPFAISADTKSADEEERFCLKLRAKAFNILQNREKTIKERFCQLAQEFGSSFNFELSKLVKIYLSLERLDEVWTEYLEGLTDFDEKIFEDKEYALQLENLACYFVFRHFSDGIYEGDYNERIKFCLLSCYIIAAMVQSGKNIEDIARMYSSEVEYSEENMEKILKAK